MKTQSQFHLIFTTEGFSSRATEKRNDSIASDTVMQRLVVFCPRDGSHTVDVARLSREGRVGWPWALGRGRGAAENRQGACIC